MAAGFGEGSVKYNHIERMNGTMKKFLTLMLTLALLLAGGAFAEGAMTLTAPSGAPALAVAVLAAENPDSYHFVAADTIASAFAAQEADFIIAPVNAGAKLFKAGKSTYKLAAVVTWGNLYVASQKADFKLEDLKNGTLTLFGENTINASIVNYALAQGGYTPAQTEYLAGAAETQALLLSDAEAMVVTAEPALTGARMKNENITAYAVNDLYKAASGFDGYTQAGLFVKAETLEKDPEGVKAYLAQAAEACNKCASDPAAVAEAAAAAGILPNAKVAQQAIPGCALRYVSAAEAREQIETTAQVDLSQFGGAVPADDFYYAE